MSTKGETLLRSRIIKRLQEECPGFWSVIHGSPFQKAGLPDIIGAYDSLFVGLEVKMPGGYPTLLQARRLDEIRAAGGIATCVHSPEEAVAAVRSYRQRP